MSSNSMTALSTSLQLEPVRNFSRAYSRESWAFPRSFNATCSARVLTELDLDALPPDLPLDLLCFLLDDEVF